jgi:hypothetical protein
MIYMKGFSYIAIPLFNLTKKDYVFKWNFNCYKTFEFLKACLVSTSQRHSFLTWTSLCEG